MLELTSFVCGAAVMVLEMAGARLLAPYLGTSIVVWTALIGVILASLSLGYWLGGRAGDKNPTARALAGIILMAAAFVLLAALVHTPLLGSLASAGLPLEASAIVAAMALFAIPSVLMGMVSPYIIQVKLLSYKDSARKNHTGSVMGRFFALSTIGSIVGTFLGGYVLISWLGTRTILYAVAGALALAAALTAPQKGRAPSAALFILCLGLGGWAGSGTRTMAQGLELDTRYNHLRIQEGYLYSGQGMMRFLSTDPGSIQSGMFLDRPNALALEYTKHYALGWHIRPEAKRFLMLGGGGYSVPKYLLEAKPDARIDVVEIDPGITAAARTYFALPENPRMRVHDEDARVFLNRAASAQQPERYDIIMGDTFTSSYNIPFHLGTVEAAQHINTLLDDDGVFVCNIISAVNGEQGRIFRSIRASFATVFPQVHAFPVNMPKQGDEVQNIMLVALKTPRPLPLSWDTDMRAMLDKEWTLPIANDTPPLTDEYAPVERYAMAILRARGR